MIVIACDYQVRERSVTVWSIANLQMGIHSVNTRMGQVNLQMGQIYVKVGTDIN